MSRGGNRSATHVKRRSYCCRREKGVHMPHVKFVMLSTIESANSKLRDAGPTMIAGANTLADLATK